jgi:hypothetical protein
MVEGALDTLRSVLNHLELNYMNSTTSYDRSIPAPQGAAALLYFLRAGEHAERTRRDELREQFPALS